MTESCDSVVLLVKRELWDVTPKDTFRVLRGKHTLSFPGVIQYKGVMCWDVEAARTLYEWIEKNAESVVLRVCFDGDPTNTDANAGRWEDCPIKVFITTDLYPQRPERLAEFVSGHLFTNRKFEDNLESANLQVEINEDIHGASVKCRARLKVAVSVGLGYGDSKAEAFNDLISKMKATRDGLSALILKMESPEPASY